MWLFRIFKSQTYFNERVIYISEKDFIANQQDYLSILDTICEE
jgi:hypothetical protein